MLCKVCESDIFLVILRTIYIYCVRVKKILKTVVPFLLAAGILWWMYRNADWEAFYRLITEEMKWGWMLFSLVFGVLPQVFRGLRWRLALDPLGEHPSRRVCSDAIFLSYASSLVIPRVGEVARCGTLKKTCGTSFSKSVGTVVTERVVDSVVLLSVTIVAFVMELPFIAEFMNRTGFDPSRLLLRATSTGMMVTIVCVLLVFLMAMWMLWHIKALESGKRFVVNMWEGVMSVWKIEDKWLYIFYSVGIWACYFLHFYIAFFAFDFTSNFSFWPALLIFCVGSFAVLVPTPNGAGPWHFAVKTMLVVYAIGAAQAEMFVLAVHTIQTFLVVLIGAYGAADLQLIARKKATLPNTDNTDAAE